MILQSGGDASDIMEMAQSIQPEDPGLAQDLAECAQDFTAETVSQFAQEQQDVVEKVADTLSTAGEPALDQAGQAADNVAQDIPDSLDSWADMFEDAAAERASGDGGANLEEVPDNFFDAVSHEDMCKTLTPAPEGCTGKPGDIPEFVWTDGYLSESWRQSDDLEVLKKNYKFDPSKLSDSSELSGAPKMASGGRPDFGDAWYADAANSLSPEQAEIFDQYGPNGLAVEESGLEWNDKLDLMQNMEQDWQQYKKINDTLEAGGTLEDLGITRRDFRKWARESTYDPSSRSGFFSTSKGKMPGGIPESYMKVLRKLVRASLK